MAFINYIEYHLPEKTYSNEDLSIEFPNWSVDKVSRKIGIESRQVAKQNESTSDLAFHAARKLFESGDIVKGDIDFLILCTQSPDYFLPTTACILQDRLGLPSTCGALDFNLGCSGFIYGLGLAQGLIKADQAYSVLLITAETYTKYLHPADKGNRSIFGDAAAATIISQKKNDSLGGLINKFVYGTDGSGANKLIVQNGAAKNPTLSGLERVDEYNNIVSEDHLYMDGRAVFNFTIDIVPTLIDSTLSKHDLVIEDIDLFIFHQANAFMLNHLRKKMGIEESKFYIDIKDIGNTVSSTIPIALSRALNNNRILKGDKVLLAGFGVGLSWGATILDF